MVGKLDSMIARSLSVTIKQLVAECRTHVSEKEIMHFQ